MNNILDIIASRRSIYPDQFTEQAIAREDIVTILEAAKWAPSHKKTEPWRFVVLQGQGLQDLGSFLAKTYTNTTSTEKFSEFKRNKLRDKPMRAGAIIAINMQRDPKERVPEWEEVAATAMAVQNMWLTATDLGLGGYWSSPALISSMDSFLKLGPNERCLGFFYLGHYTRELEEPRKKESILDKVRWM